MKKSRPAYGRARPRGIPLSLSLPFRGPEKQQSFGDYLHNGDNVMLVGKTGCGKTRLVETWAAANGQELISFLLSSADPKEIMGGLRLGPQGSFWPDSPLVQAVKRGAVFYFDEIGAVDECILKMLFPLLDQRRWILVDGKAIAAAPGFRFVASYNPHYGNAGRGFTPDFRHRFTWMWLDYLPPDEEQALLVEAGASPENADFLVRVAVVTRTHRAGPVPEGASTRLLLRAVAHLEAGLPRDQVIQDCIVLPLSDDLHARQAVLQALESAGLLSIDHVRQLQLDGPRSLSLPVVDDHFFDTEGSDPDQPRAANIMGKTNGAFQE